MFMAAADYRSVRLISAFVVMGALYVREDERTRAATQDMAAGLNGFGPLASRLSSFVEALASSKSTLN
jgi:hypothetical protein